MQLAAPATTRPRDLPALALRPALDFAKDAARLDGPTWKRPEEITELSLQVLTPGEPTEFYAAASIESTPYVMKRGGFSAAMAGAQQLARSEESVAVMQSAKDGARYLVPLGVWDPNDESELRFGDIGGTPYWNSPRDHLLLRNDSSSDVEAVIFDGGRQWINMTGHPVRLPEA